jgi:hypothetical protein
MKKREGRRGNGRMDKWREEKSGFVRLPFLLFSSLPIAPVTNRRKR